MTVDTEVTEKVMLERGELETAAAENASNEETKEPSTIAEDTITNQDLVELENQIRQQVNPLNFAVSSRWEEDEIYRLSEGQLSNNSVPRSAFANKLPCCVSCCNLLFCRCAKPLGGMKIIWSKTNGEPSVVAGPFWMFCTFVTVPLILGISGMLVWLLFFSDAHFKVPFWVIYIYIPIVVLTLLSLACVSCRDPGLIRRVNEIDDKPQYSNWFWNEQVKSYRPPRAMYCRECKVMINGYDHLCPWTGTGIGKSNMTAFKFFVGFVNVSCYMSVILMLLAAFSPAI